jgi:hypothetical protein
MYQKLASLLLNIMKVCVVVPIVVLQTCGLVALATLSAMANLCLILGTELLRKLK